jgi:hypothetical protein
MFYVSRPFVTYLLTLPRTMCHRAGEHSGNALDWYPVGAQFESRRGHR